MVTTLPPDLPAAVFAVLHIPPWHSSRLANAISSGGALRAVQAQDQKPIERGLVYAAPPDRDLLIEGDRIQLWRGPKENGHRPAINPLFRSSAITYGERVTGVILTGLLDDGAAGLWWVKRYRGVAIVQDPQEARFPDMPRNALEHVNVDYVSTVAALQPLLVQLAGGSKVSVSSEREDA